MYSKFSAGGHIPTILVNVAAASIHSAIFSSVLLHLDIKNEKASSLTA